MKQGITSLMVLALCVAWGQAAETQPAPWSRTKLLKYEALRARRSSFSKPTKGDGTVNPHATVAKLKAEGGLTIAIAIDSKAADAKAPDIVRFDFTGKGKFDDNVVAPLEHSTSGRTGGGSFALSTSVKVGGKDVPVDLSGNYHKSDTYRRLSLDFGTAVQAKCRFGEKTYPVTILDGNKNLRLGDKASGQLGDGKCPSLNIGDTVAIQTGESEVIGAFYGVPIRIGGVWYDVALSPDGKTIQVQALPELKSGQLKIDQDSYSVELSGEKYTLILRGDAEPIRIPADRYTVVRFSQTIEGPEKDRVSRLAFGHSSGHANKFKVFQIAAGEVTELKMGAPLVGRADVKKRTRSGEVSIRLDLKDVAGMPLDDLSISGTRSGRPPAPKVKVRDAAGKIVHTATLEYG